MNCSESRKLMSAYVDNELDSGDAIRVAAHLTDCPACKADYEETLGLHALISDHAVRHPAPAHLHRRIQAVIDREKPVAPKERKIPWAWINFGLATACSSAFAFMLALHIAMPSDAEHFDQELVADHYRSLMVDHLTDVASSDHHTVKPWFTGKIDFSPPVHDLAQQGFPLIGGRLDYLDRRTAAVLAYQHGKHLINLFVLPDQANKDMAVESGSRQGFQLVHWTKAGLAYWAISDTNIQELLEFQRILVFQPN